VLIGQVERWEAGRMALQEQNYSRLLSDVTKLVIEVNDPNLASEAMARAFHVAESGTPGPVAVIVPEDRELSTLQPGSSRSSSYQGREVLDSDEASAANLARSASWRNSRRIVPGLFKG